MPEKRILILATHNPDKVTELKELFQGLPLAEIRSAADYPDLEEAEETGHSLAENALIKARHVARATRELCIADDTGLEVDALNGAPGIYAARFAGQGATYANNCHKLLHALRDVPEISRGALFRTVMALVDPRARRSERESTVEGVLEGSILIQPRGSGGFGYDPVFFVLQEQLSLAEMTLEQKNRISHRAQAGMKMRALLEGYLERD